MDFTDSNFDAEVIKSEVPVLVDFWASWCGPCKMISPMIDRIAAAYAGKLKVGKMDVDSNSASPSSLGVRSLPTLMFFKGGKMADQIIGVVSEVQLKKIVDKIIA
jgi:thioredoxin 1